MEPKVRYIDEKPIHFSVGAFIKNDKGEYLLIDRLKKPFGFACPAGHVDENEHSYAAVVREVEEETGLKVISAAEIDIDECDDVPQEICSRGVDYHVWMVYDIKAEGELIFKEDEVKSIGWYSIEQIKELPLESVWKFWFTKLKLI
jgi:ADP-ribose pyrophosphatase YjhB (NUDIX family)